MVSTLASPPETAGDAALIERRQSLSRGPALILGTILLAAGLYFLYKQHRFPPLGNFPNGRAPVNGDVFLGVFGANGWTGMGTAIAGGLLLFGAAEHFLSKGMSLFVGLALAVAAIVAAISGDVFGLAAANIWTKVGWGASALILLLNVVVPARHRLVRVTRTVPATATEPPAGVPVSGAPVAAAPAGAVPAGAAPVGAAPVGAAPAGAAPVGAAPAGEAPVESAPTRVVEPAEVR